MNSPILIAGCQRSGGTMLARAFTDRKDIADFTWSKDAELDGAQVLAGTVNLGNAIDPASRFCFQTTYLNEQAVEYANHSGKFKLIWLIRNPYSVVYSMVHNWKRFALNEVFLACGASHMSDLKQQRLKRFGVLAIHPIERACYAYLGKLSQATQLLETLTVDDITTVEYETLVTDKTKIMAKLFRFCDLPFIDTAGEKISTRSMKKSSKLGLSERETVSRICDTEYQAFVELSIRTKL